MKTLEIKFNEDELPAGYSGGKVYEDGEICVSFCSGNVDNDSRPVVVVNLPQYELRLLGGARFRRQLEDIRTDQWFRIAIEYVFMNSTPSMIRVIFQHIHNCGVEKGEKKAKELIRNALGV